MMKHYDYIICGAGAAGLALAYRLSDAAFSHLDILLLEKSPKTKNDRTWCYWSEGDGLFDHLAKHSWDKIIFKNDDFEKRSSIYPLKYYMLKGLDYYEHTLSKINQAKHLTVSYSEVNEISTSQEKAVVQTAENTYTADWVFSSILDNSIDKQRHNYVDQHFKGWFIKTKNVSFDPSAAVIMDFTIEQLDECRFMYVLPTSATEALVEVAIFSNNILDQTNYDKIIASYIKDQLQINQYEVEETEFAIIPMTTYPFEKRNQHRLSYIGTAGSAAKASTGYAFQFSQEQAKFLAQKISKGEDPIFPKSYYKTRFRWYDNILLNVLLHNRAPLSSVFGDMFNKLDPRLILKFLSNQTGLAEEFRILMTPAKLPFIKAAINESLRTK